LQHDNYNATERVAWLVDSVRDYRDVCRVLRTGVCWTGEQRATAKDNTGGPKGHAQAVLRAFRMGNS